MTDVIIRRRRLPHQDVEGHPYFITACLHGSLSASGLAKIARFRNELESRCRPDSLTSEEWDHQKQKLLFGFVDGLLDGDSPVRHLADSRQAQIVQNAFLHFAEVRYQLLAFVVMPSHMHWLFQPIDSWSVSAVKKSARDDGRTKTPREIIAHSTQSYTATMCNRIRSASGPYWQHESFDHWARDEAETLRIINYIEMNPVKAGLVSQPHEFEFSSARIRKEFGLLAGDAIPGRKLKDDA